MADVHQMTIVFEPGTGRVNVQYPENKVICDFMLCEARRILDRSDDKRIAGEGNGRIIVPALVPPNLGTER